MVRRRIVLALLLFAWPASAQDDVQPCRSPVCTPPATWRSVRSIPPLDAPVRFGGADRVGMWTWLKDGESSTPCTATEEARLRRISAEHADSYRRACDVAIGEPLFRTMQFQVPRASSRSQSSIVSESAIYGAYVLEDHPPACIRSGGWTLTRCGREGTNYSQPYTTFVAVRLPRASTIEPDRCIGALTFDGDGGPTGVIFFSESQVRLDATWIRLPLRTRAPAPGRAPIDTRIEIKATPYRERNCWSIGTESVGEVVLSRVDVHLLPRTKREALP